MSFYYSTIHDQEILYYVACSLIAMRRESWPNSIAEHHDGYTYSESNDGVTMAAVKVQLSFFQTSMF